MANAAASGVGPLGIQGTVPTVIAQSLPNVSTPELVRQVKRHAGNRWLEITSVVLCLCGELGRQNGARMCGVLELVSAVSRLFWIAEAHQLRRLRASHNEWLAYVALALLRLVLGVEEDRLLHAAHSAVVLALTVSVAVLPFGDVPPQELPLHLSSLLEFSSFLGVSETSSDSVTEAVNDYESKVRSETKRKRSIERTVYARTRIRTKRTCDSPAGASSPAAVPNEASESVEVRPDHLDLKISMCKNTNTSVATCTASVTNRCGGTEATNNFPDACSGLPVGIHRSSSGLFFSEQGPFRRTLTAALADKAQLAFSRRDGKQDVEKVSERLRIEAVVAKTIMKELRVLEE